MEIIEAAFAQLSESQLKSPINLDISQMTVVNLKPLNWFNYENLPKKLKLTNTGRNAVLCGQWRDSPPHLSSGLFRSSYVFSQMHFHWGVTEMTGSEHFVDGGSQPMELHAVHFKSDYTSQQNAMREDDGIVIIVYFFKLQSVPNSALDDIIRSLSLITPPNSSVRISPVPIINILRPFSGNYFVYKGTAPVGRCHHQITWIISREPIAMSIEQVAAFRNLNDFNFNRILNSRRPLESVNTEVFFVNPDGSNYASLVRVPQDPIPPTASQRAVEDEDNDEYQ